MKTDREKHLEYVIKFALEMQKSVETAKPEGYGAAPNTNAWMDLAKEALNLPQD